MSNLSDFLFPKATQAQAEAGTSNSVLMTPLTTAQAIAMKRGSANGIASLDANGKVPTAQIDDSAFAKFYQGNTEGELNLPIGSLIAAVISSDQAPNSVVSPPLKWGTSNFQTFPYNNMGTGGAVMGGTWVVRGPLGTASSNFRVLVQRIG